jgi:hypothetical protein
VSLLQDLFSIDDPEEIPSQLWVHRVDVERSSSAGRDASGNPVTAWTTTYTGLRCFVESLSAHEKLAYRQEGLDLSHHVYFPVISTTEKTLPDIRGRDRIRFGTRKADGKPRYLGIVDVHDLMEVGGLLVTQCQERIPGG